VPMNRVIKPSNMTLAWHVTCRREKMFIQNRPLGKPRSRWKDNIKVSI
jgi:hypothetical protein